MVNKRKDFLGLDGIIYIRHGIAIHRKKGDKIFYSLVNNWEPINGLVINGIGGYDDGMMTIYTEGIGCNVIDLDTNQLILDNWVKSIYNISEGVISTLEYDNSSKYIRRDGKTIYKLQKNKTPYRFNNGYAIICGENGFFHINKEGNEITSKRYKSIQEFNDGFALVRDKEGYNFIDENGKELINGTLPMFAENFHDGYAICYSKKGDKYKLNKNGEKIKIEEKKVEEYYHLPLIRNARKTFQSMKNIYKCSFNGENIPNAFFINEEIHFLDFPNISVLNDVKHRM